MLSDAQVFNSSLECLDQTYVFSLFWVLLAAFRLNAMRLMRYMARGV